LKQRERRGHEHLARIWKRSHAMGIERRRDRRYPFHVPLVLSDGRREIVTQTEDVSFKGIFVRSDTPLRERHLVRLRLTLPPEGDELEVMGMATRFLPARQGLPPGAGIQLYGLAQANRERWDRFIRYVVASTQAPAAATAALPGGAADVARRQYPRYAAALQVHLHTLDDLHLLYTRNVSRGGLFVGTALQLPAGTALRVNVIHPKTGEQFPLEAIVRWRAEAPEPGLGLEFVQLTERRRDEFFEFIRSEIPVEQVFYVADGNPHLAPSGAPATGRAQTQLDVQPDDP
jgi:hypothetical protein